MGLLSLAHLRSAARLTQGQPKAHAEVQDFGRLVAAIRRPAAVGRVEPAPAAKHPVRAPRGSGRVGGGGVIVSAAAVPIPAPLPDVSMHVMQAEPIGRFAAHRVRSPLRSYRRTTRRSPSSPASSPNENRRRSGRIRPAGIFPLRLRRQTIALPVPVRNPNIFPSIS